MKQAKKNSNFSNSKFRDEILQAGLLSDGSDDEAGDYYIMHSSDIDFIDDREDENLSMSSSPPRLKRTRDVQGGAPRKRARGENGLYLWDFTLRVEGHEDHNKIVEELKKHCKKWCFQQEEGKDHGYLHWQGRISLVDKKRIGTLRALFVCWPSAHWSITSNNGKKSFNYVMKEDTRTKGPWCDTDKVVYVPRHIREIKTLKKWQARIYNSAGTYEPRIINMLIEETGGIGKSVLVGKMMADGLARALPPFNDFKDINRAIMGMPTSKCYIVDMPRALEKGKQRSFFAGLESLKNGYVFDDRYSWKEKWFDPPVVWVFTNTVPELEFLSRDRWVFWKVVRDELVRYYPKTESVAALHVPTPQAEVLVDGVPVDTPAGATSSQVPPMAEFEVASAMLDLRAIGNDDDPAKLALWGEDAVIEGDLMYDWPCGPRTLEEHLELGEFHERARLIDKRAQEQRAEQARQQRFISEYVKLFGHPPSRGPGLGK